MPHPWHWDPKWVESARFYNITRDMPEWQDYVQTVGAFYYNSMALPMYVSFAILGTFGVLVLLATMKQLLYSLIAVRQVMARNALAKSIRKHVVNAPLFRLRHAQSVPLLGRFVSLQLPLRLDSIILCSLFMVNLLPIVTFYRPYTKNNIYWPIHYDEILRYVSDRSGVMATMELPPLFILAGRNNLVSWATGCSYEKCMLYHRWFARFVFAQVIVHAIGYSLVYGSHGGLAGFRSMFASPYMRWGTASTLACALCVGLSPRYLRQKSYEVFVMVHAVMALVVLVGTYYHVQLLHFESFADFLDAIYFCVATNCLDKAARAFRILLYSINVKEGALAISKNTVDVISQDEWCAILRHEVTLQGYGKRTSSLAGQGKYIQLWLPRLQPLSSHPFTVAQVCCKPGSDEMCAYLYSKVHRGVTNSLLRRISSSAQKRTTHFALVEGFYGHVPSTEGYGQVLLFSGGIGITACWPVFLQAKEGGRFVHMDWIVCGPAELYTLADILERTTQVSMTNEEGTKARTDGLRNGSDRNARMTIHVTRTLLGHDDGGDDDIRTSLHRLALEHRIQVDFSSTSGRPSIVKLLERDSKTDDTLVISCGPSGVCDDARKAANIHDLPYFEIAFQW